MQSFKSGTRKRGIHREGLRRYKERTVTTGAACRKKKQRATLKERVTIRHRSQWKENNGKEDCLRGESVITGKWPNPKKVIKVLKICKEVRKASEWRGKKKGTRFREKSAMPRKTERFLPYQKNKFERLVMGKGGSGRPLGAAMTAVRGNRATPWNNVQATRQKGESHGKLSMVQVAKKKNREGTGTSKKRS